MAKLNIKYAPSQGLREKINQAAKEYFASKGKDSRGDYRLFLKTGILAVWATTSYLLLVFGAAHWWTAVPLAISLGLAFAGIGFNVGHDGNHGSYARSPFVNHIMERSYDILGASSYYWRWKHNTYHHNFTNIHGVDDDINLGPLCRMTPYQKLHWHHRYQHIYMLFLYGFIHIKWVFFDDFNYLISGRLSSYDIPRPKGWRLAELFLGKILFVTVMLVVPSFFHPFWLVLLMFLLVSFSLGVTLSVVFQLAHCTTGATFTTPPEDHEKMEMCWASNQLMTTVNFAPKNPLVTWYVGGLNYQVEHHLFPKVSHCHLPALAGMVEKAAKEYGVCYLTHDTMFGAFKAHMKWLRKMGQPQTT